DPAAERVAIVDVNTVSPRRVRVARRDVDRPAVADAAREDQEGVDVNAGRFIGCTDLDQTAVRDAAKEARDAGDIDAHRIVVGRARQDRAAVRDAAGKSRYQEGVDADRAFVSDRLDQAAVDDVANKGRGIDIDANRILSGAADGDRAAVRDTAQEARG